MTARRRRPDFEPPPIGSEPARISPPPDRAAPHRHLGSAVTAALALATTLAIALTTTWSRNGVDDPLVSRFAEDFVYTYLTASPSESPEALAQFLGFVPALNGMDVSRLTPRRVAAGEPFRRDGAWLVHVAVDLVETREGGATASGSRTFMVRLRAGPELRALALPAPIDLRPTTTPLAHRPDNPPDDDETASAIEDMLIWWLTSDDPAGPYRPVGGFEAVEVTSLELDEEAGLVGVVATSPAGSRLRLDIPIVRDGGAWWPEDLSPESN